MYWYAGQKFDRRTIEVDIDEPGLLYGASVFTTLRVDSATGTLGERLEPEIYALHCDRLRQTIDRFDWMQPDWDRIDRGVRTLAPEFPVLRIAIFPNGYELITGRNLPPQLAIWRQSGITVTIADREFCRSLPHYKTGNYLAPWLALKQARERDIQEAILTNDRGDWLETTTGNLWGYRDGNWYTPPLSAGILPGIARTRILARLSQQGKDAIEMDWCAEWVKDLESIGYSNSVVGFIPIHTVITALGNLRYTIDPLHESELTVCY